MTDPDDPEDTVPVGIGHPVTTNLNSCAYCKRVKTDKSWTYCPWCGHKYDLPDMTTFQG